MDVIRKLISKFATDLERAIADREKQALAAVRAGIMTGLAVGGAKVSPKHVVASILEAHGKSRRKGPVQLCPVPGCKERAAPSLHMVCSDHRNVPKKLIAKYRQARRARNAKKGGK
ncbi:MAG TPA: hypothetical protein VHG72_21615 [Polyangia bacterium]|nr:hypothetical protein [Polyangia bacterium]